MEDRPRPIENENESTARSDEARQGRVKRAFSSFRGKGEPGESWANILRGNEDDDDEEESVSQHPESSEPITPRERRGRRIANSMKALFERPERVPEPSKQEESLDEDLPKASEFLFNNFSTLRPRHETDDAEELIGETVPTTEVADDSGVNEPLEAHEREVQYDYLEPLELPPVDIGYSTELSEPAESDAYEPVLTEVDVPVAPSTNIPEGGTVPDRSWYASPEHTANTVIHHERVELNTRDERLRKAVTGLLLVDLIDYVSTKRRENKIKKDNKAEHEKFTKEQNIQKTDHLELAERTKKLEQEAVEKARKLQREAELKRVQMQQININQAATSTQISQETEATVVQKAENTTIVEAPEVRRVVTNIEREVKDKVPDLIVQPQEILKAVEKAAEKNVAIESLYEKRHEARGNEAASQWAGRSATGTPKQPQLSGPLAEWAQPQQTQLSDEVQFPTPTIQQKSATGSGVQSTLIIFGALVIVLLIFLVAVMLTK